MYVDIGAKLYHHDEKIEVFPFLPNYRRDFIERWEWKTDVLTSFDDHEQRRALRHIPRRYVEYEVFAQGVDRAAFEAFMWRQPLSLFAIPDWNNGIRITPDMVQSATVALVEGNFFSNVFGLNSIGGLPQIDLKNPDVLSNPFEMVNDQTGTPLFDNNSIRIYSNQPALEATLEPVNDQAGIPLFDSANVRVYAGQLFDYLIGTLTDSAGVPLSDSQGVPLFGVSEVELIDINGSILFDMWGSQLYTRLQPDTPAWNIPGMQVLGTSVQPLAVESIALQTTMEILEEPNLFRHPIINMASLGGLVQLTYDSVVVDPSFLAIGDTSLTTFIAGGYIIGFSSPSEFQLHRIKEVHPGGLLLDTQYLSTTGAVLYPALLGRLKTEQTFTRETPNFTHGVVSFNVLQEPSVFVDYQLALPTYLNLPVLEHTFNWAGGRQVQYGFKAKLIDVETNNPTVYVESSTPGISQPTNWFLNGQDQIHDFLGLIHVLSGKLEPFWLPTFSRDLFPVAAAGNRLEVQGTGYAHFGTQDPNHTHLRIELFNGSVLYCKVMDRIYLETGIDVLTLNTTISDVAQIKMISFMNVARLDQDLIELAYKGPGFAQSQITTRTLKYDI